jgi:hypothetical protein
VRRRLGTNMEAGGNVERAGTVSWLVAREVLQAKLLWLQGAASIIVLQRVGAIPGQAVPTVVSLRTPDSTNASRSTDRMWTSSAACSRGLAGTRQLLQNSRPLTRTTPPPPGKQCSYGDAFAKRGAGGCCQICQHADEVYTHYKDSDWIQVRRAPSYLFAWNPGVTYHVWFIQGTNVCA